MIDEQALENALEENPDETLALLADLTGATDEKLRELARRLAAQLFLDVAKRGPSSPRGVGQLRTQRYRPDGGDLDVDASLDAVVSAELSGSGGRSRRSADPGVVEAGHRDLPARRSQRVDGRRAARHRGGHRVGGVVAGAGGLLGAVVRQGRDRREVTGRRRSRTRW